MMKVPLILLSTFGIILFYQNCSPLHSNQSGGASSFSSSNVSVDAFAKTVYPILRQPEDCAQCHGDFQKPLFSGNDPEVAHDIMETYGLVNFERPGDSYLVTKIRDGHLDFSDEFADQLEDAIIQWAELVAEGPIDVTPDEISSNFSDIKEKILVARCIKCHNSSAGPTVGDFTSYDKLMATGVVVPNDGASSKLLIRILPGGGMPSDGSAELSAVETDAVEKWINEGAQNN